MKKNSTSNARKSGRQPSYPRRGQGPYPVANNSYPVANNSSYPAVSNNGSYPAVNNASSYPAANNGNWQNPPPTSVPVVNNNNSGWREPPPPYSPV